MPLFLPPSRSKIISLTRDMTAASGSVSYTTVGFKPTSLFVLGGVSFTQSLVVGFADAALGIASEVIFDTQSFANANLVNIIEPGSGGSKAQSATLTSYDDLGFTWLWTKLGAPAANTATIYVLCRGP
jgi:hypothetical protein